jgi:HlyD family secretion protein
MRQPRKRWSFGLTSAGVVVVLALSTALAVPRLKEWFAHSPSLVQQVPTTTVRRADLNVTLTTGGKVESKSRTKIEVELARVGVSVTGQGMTSGGVSTVLSVIPDGTKVREGDVLCELDASEYVELLRQQKMTVERVRADHRRAELILEVAEMAVKEFKEGLLAEAFKELESLIALGESTVRRSDDRLAWSKRMLEKGYLPASQVSAEEFNKSKAEFDLLKGRLELDVFRRFSAPRALRSLEGAVHAAEAGLNYQDRNLQRQIERQEMLESQVENCTIRAPHGGLIIYDFDDHKQIHIEEGMVVHQGQDLFYLPDLDQMEAMAMVHESVASMVRPGMRARVQLEGLPGRIIEGHVTSVAQLPTQNFFNEVRYFYTEVALDTKPLPEGLLPGMSAEIEISTEQRVDVVAIPIGALAFEEGREVCYVVQEDRIERRPIKVGQSTRGMLEVIDGLDEGEQIVLNPEQFDTDLESISQFRSEPDSPGDRVETE